MFLFLTVLQAIIAAALVGVILMQRSEGGALGMGGSPGGLMSARGAADLLTRTTTVLAILFVSLSIILAVKAAGVNSSSTIDQSLQRDVPAAETSQPAPATSEDPLSAVDAGDSGSSAPSADSESAPAAPAPATDQ
mgnify:CR=1 FL=1